MSDEKQENPIGRPTKYKPEFTEQAYKLCLLGATDKELADFFDVDESTITRWKQEIEEFCTSIKKGKVDADANVADSLYKRACGYEHPEDHISQYEGEAIITPTIKHYPPDPTACIFWLKNRRKNEWRDRHEFAGPDGGPIPVQIINFSKVQDDTVEAVLPKSPEA
jgi:hypothetical protein